ncbi:hypothetical protein E0698_19170 [Paenibacillus sp. 23TSA30-6]|nr:hypothetical protein [Paenibacillus sp. 23TSA30-6]
MLVGSSRVCGGAAFNASSYLRRACAQQTTSWWQSLSFEANYKCSYCLAVCPAGEDVIGPFLKDRKGFMNDVLKPLQGKEETVYVTPGSDAEAYVMKRFPHKTAKRVGNGLRPGTIRLLIGGMPHAFQPKQASGLNCTYHFTFTGDETRQSTFGTISSRLGTVFTASLIFGLRWTAKHG